MILRIDPPIAAPPHTTQAPPIEHAGWTSRIAAAWQKGVEAILETGRLLIEAKAALKHGEFESMVQLKLPFNPGTAQRLMAVARHPVISNAAHAPLLPPSWMTLYELTKLSPETLLPKIEDGSITPKTERRDVIASSPTRRTGWPRRSSSTRCSWCRRSTCLRLAFLESTRRSAILESGTLARVHVFKRRLPMMQRDGWAGPRASSAVAFAWFVWDSEHRGPAIIDHIIWEAAP
jgi:Protein of unknown function (DUF3102)